MPQAQAQSSYMALGIFLILQDSKLVCTLVPLSYNLNVVISDNLPAFFAEKLQFDVK